ncbi:hypothetical protein [Chryseobacterium scophthalmum]|uniref:hypothetical protein n=1 Tax=Chryseobacterium scophthalmum TaxID=59733 RepID=UPI003D02A46D
MNWTKFKTYGNDNDMAFEMLCNQLFENYLKRTYGEELTVFRAVNGAAGDGGIEAYGILRDERMLVVQAKWFQGPFGDTQIKQIKDSINTALSLRPSIREYFVCIPRDLASLKYVRGKGKGNKQPVKDPEDSKFTEIENEMKEKYPNLQITWWFDHNLDTEIAEEGNAGIHNFWFERDIISLAHLEDLFRLSKVGWLDERYIPELHAQGKIHKTIQELSFSEEFRNIFKADLLQHKKTLEIILKNIDEFHEGEISASLKRNLFADFSLRIKEEINSLNTMIDALDTGNDIYQAQTIDLFDVDVLLDELKGLIPVNGQYGQIPTLLDAIESYKNFREQNIDSSFYATMRLILGEPGTGKTHGLTNAVDIHISNGFPAIIIQAKAALSHDWASLLNASLSLSGWSRDEIFSALEALAVQADYKRARKKDNANNFEQTKILICVDGLEEDFGKEAIWYTRMREAEIFMESYPRLKFVFSARSYFYQKAKVPKGKGFATVFLPNEGDVPVWSVAEEYFSKDHFNIKIESFSKVRGINSLFALRLFCEEYRDTCIEADEDILTATNALLEKKIDRLEDNFKELYKESSGISEGSMPVGDALEAVSNAFLKRNELDQDALRDVVKESVGGYLANYEILIDFLVNNGMLIRSEMVDQMTNGRKRKKSLYKMLSNSIIEMIVASSIADDITEGKIVDIPKEFKNIDQEESGESVSAQLIVQTTIDQLFVGQDKLIGDDGFLTDGIGTEKINSLRLKALMNAKGEQVKKYTAEVTEMLLSPGEKQFNVLINLILPSSRFNGNPFGGMFLHNVLKELPNTFDRDRIWSGPDDHEEFILNVKDIQGYSLKRAFVRFAGEDLSLSPYALFDETPLIFAWALSNIDQDLRSRLRSSLAVWAMKQPEEFEKLLNVIFNVGDPQIQEDLASIMLALAGNLKDKESIERLAKWSLKNVFDKLKDHRDVILRQGMRGIVERAYSLDLVTSVEVNACRPKYIENDDLIPLDGDAVDDSSEEIYPIVRDLAWYVIKEAYEDFLDYEETDESVEFLKRYSEENADAELFPHNWAMAAAIAYIKKLGFNRITGSGFTDSTHGSKSKKYTYEEKYTWLAVHFIQGYLSDNLPANELTDDGVLSDYSLLTPIPNPGESQYFQKSFWEKVRPARWVINAPLVKENIEGVEIEEFVKNAIESEPVFDFCDWLEFEEIDFSLRGDDPMIVLYNKTKVHDSNELYMGLLTVRAAIIKKGSLDNLSPSGNELDFVEDLDHLEAKPATHTYSNPTDIVWMDWIGETENETFFIDLNGDREIISKVITEVTTDSPTEGESWMKIPSKFVRRLVGIVELTGGKFKNINGDTISFRQEIKDNKGNNQELLVINKNIMLASLEKAGLEMVWFVEFLQHTNYSNHSLINVGHHQKVRKYMVKWNGTDYLGQKFWDSKFTNKR